MQPFLASLLVVGSVVAGTAVPVEFLSVGPTPDAADRVLWTAEVFTAARAPLEAAFLEPWLLGQAQADLQAARALAVGPAPSPALALAVLTQRQAGIAGVEPLPPGDRGRLPSAALADLAAQRGLRLPSEVVAAAAGLDALPAPARDAVADLVGSFAALEAATAARDPGAMLGARQAFVRSAFDLHAALPAGPRPPPVVLAPVFALDLGGDASTYEADVALLVDAGGDDVYRNNAGGSSAADVHCRAGVAGVAAALVDLDGDDRYGADRDCGANGGSSGGAGVLVDLGGEDVYQGGGRGVNGGARHCGLALLLDGGDGDDTYLGEAGGVQGGGYEGCIVVPDELAGDVPPLRSQGALLDFGGDDTYRARGVGANGGGLRGAGFLYDAGGDDTYDAGTGEGANGGAHVEGLGFLVDRGVGRDAYLHGYDGVHGGAAVGSSGFLFDGGGDDLYTADDPVYGGTLGANGGGAHGGRGVLLDAGGADEYVATVSVTFPCFLGGRPGSCGANGGGYFEGAGLLVDLDGDDRYLAVDFGANGGGFGGLGALLDQAGDDVYRAGAGGVNGGGHDPAETCLLQWCYGHPGLAGLGLLLDQGGRDRYVEEGVEAWDALVMPKGLAGAQVDLSEAPGSDAG